MIRNLKVMGLALIAIFAVGALSASAASATDFFTTANGKPALLTGVSHKSKFLMTGPNKDFTCTTAKYAATVTNGVSSLTVDALFEGTLNVTPHTEHHCNSTLGTVTVDMNGCDFKLTGETTGEDPPVVGKDATVWVECPLGKVIQITGPAGIVISIPAQTPTVGGVTYTNEAGGKVKVKATATGVTYTCASAFACGLAGIPTHGNDADYTDEVVISGFVDNNAAHVITPANEGAALGISFS
jgi:hypothetical protein